MKTVITYGTYDLLHEGHINLLRRAKELGDYLIVGVTSEDFDRSRGKINVQQSLVDRMKAVQATGFADLIIPEEYFGQKIDDIRRYQVDVFTVGSDWVGHFDYLKEFCDVVYLDRTEGVSSTELRAESNHIAIGLVGDNAETDKFISESKHVSGVELSGICDYEGGPVQSDRVVPCVSFDDLLGASDALYIACAPTKRAEATRRALTAGKHVLCESPIAYSETEARELITLAHKRGVVLFEGIKTAYALAFRRLMLLVKSNHLGEVRSVRATCTRLLDRQQGSLEEWGSIAALAVFSALGTDYVDASCVTRIDEQTGLDSFTKIDLLYNSAVGSILVANGAKAEGDLVIAGTKAYAYVPSPWWKTDYFEIRHENPAENRRYFYQLDGEGIRHEIAAFSRAVAQADASASSVPEDVTIALAKLLGDFQSGALNSFKLSQSKASRVSMQ